MITDIAHGEVDLDTLKAGASLIPVAKITKVPKVIKAVGNVGKTRFKKGKEGEKIAKSGQAKQTKAKNKGGSEPEKNNRRQALNKAKDLAGVPRSQQPVRQWIVGDDVKRREYENYVYDTEPSHHGRFYEYNTPNGKRVVVEHTNDEIQELHVHAGMPKGDSNDMNYNFKENRYQKITGKDGDHHIRYK